MNASYNVVQRFEEEQESKLSAITDENEILKLLAENAYVVRVNAEFFTLDLNKDRDTVLECWVNLPGPTEAAYGVVPNEAYPRYSFKDLPLEVRRRITKQDLNGSWFQVRIHPNGDDSWKFRTKCTLVFSDNSHYVKEFPHTTVSEPGSGHGNERRFPL